jgi:hypothetical protein
MAGNSFAGVIGKRRERLKIRTNRVEVSLSGHKGGGIKSITPTPKKGPDATVTEPKVAAHC